MTQEEINNYNHRCARFLGSELKNDGQFDYWTYDHLGYDPMVISGVSWVSGNFEFHSNWNWIMEVVERIKYVDKNQDEFFYFLIDFKIDLLHGVELIIDEKRLFLQTAFEKDQLKEAVVGGINQFLIWYEEILHKNA